MIPKVPSEAPAETPALRLFSPTVNTDQLVPGIDNIRFDVSLSPKFVRFCQGLLLQLIVKHSSAAELLRNSPGPPKPAAKKEFRDLLQDLLVTVLNRANAEKKPQIEVLAQAAIFKFLILEAQTQFAEVIAQGREKLILLQRPGQEHNRRGYQIQELLAAFQANKRIVFRRLGQEMLDMVSEVRGDAVRKTRAAIFGAETSEPHAIFSNPLLFTEDGKNDYVNLDNYVMLGNFQKDSDHYETVDSELRAFLEWADLSSEESRVYHSRQQACAETSTEIEELRKRLAEPTQKRVFFSRGARNQKTLSPEEMAGRIRQLEARLNEQMESFRAVAETYKARLEQMAAAPENAVFLADFIQSEQRLAEARKAGADRKETASLEAKIERQKQALERLYRQLSDAGVFNYILAAYETAKIYQELCPPLNPQQLKEALVDAGARKKVAHLIAEYRMPAAASETVARSAAWVRDASARQARMALIRFLRDYMRYQQDLCKFRLFQQLLDQIHYPLDTRQRELSGLNHTLYDFLLAEEEKEPTQGKVSSHVILKADIRDSTSITAELFARELNPASYFSLNFFDPIHKLLPRYGASKVFLEGDAIILSILEAEGPSRQAYSVARACCLGREMIEGVRAVNDRAAKKNLPVVELGIGICYQDSAPMYLMDGERPVMISKALNLSDRLSSCGKLAKQLLAQHNRFFNVFVMQLLPGAESAGSPEELVLHYNVEGIEINDLAFTKLCEELSMTKLELQFPLYGEPETVALYCGTLPLGESFQKLVVRLGRVPQLHPKDYKVVDYTDNRYYEVCSSKPLYDYVGKQLGW
jgi:hypothetical protein